MTEDQLLITEEDLGERIDKLLKRHYPEYSRTYFTYLIEKNLVLLNGEPIKKRFIPSIGDTLTVFFEPPPLLDVEPENIPLNILYEDEHLLIVNKPAGMVVHPAPGAYSGTFANALLYHCKELEKSQFEPLRPGIVHRLDKDTTGVLIAAKTPQAHQKLTQLFAERKIEKRYIAICNGVPPAGEFSAAIKRHPVHRTEMAVDETGKEAISSFKILEKKPLYSIVEVQLITGRTHQIRVHLKHLNCPILGDPVYGSNSLNQRYALTRQMLHASSIQFVHPFTSSLVHIVAPLPDDMKKFY